jgi:ferredoxin
MKAAAVLTRGTFFYFFFVTVTTQTRICDAFGLMSSKSSNIHSMPRIIGNGISSSSPLSLMLSSSSSNENKSGNNNDDDNNNPVPIDVSQDDRLYRVRLSRATGIDWGTDLSFSFVYVRDLDPTGDAAASGLVQKGDQLCEVMPVKDNNEDNSPSIPVNLVGASFNSVMSALAGLDRSVQLVDLVFFRGTKEELKAAATGDDGSGGSSSADKDTITVTVIQNKGSRDETTTTLEAPTGANVRQLLVDNGINVYQSLTRWTNCKGKQLCGTCIVNVVDGAPNTNWKSMDEASTLRANPDSYRLSCVTFAHGDVTVETFPPVNADQWTR